VEQLVARWAHNPKVVCSSQASATKEDRQSGGLFHFIPFSNTKSPQGTGIPIKNERS
jgi:hypothetical protein